MVEKTAEIADPSAGIRETAGSLLNLQPESASKTKNKNEYEEEHMMVVALLVSSIAFAQMKQGGMHGQYRGQADRMKEVLALSEAQYASVKALDEKYTGKFKQMREEGSVTRDDFSKLRNEKRTEINAVLTEEQQQSWKAYQAERKAERQKAHEKRKAGQKSDLKSSLGLTDEQLQRIQEVNREFAGKRKLIMNDAEASQEDKKTRLTTLRSEHDNAVKAILTPEQYEKWKSERKQYAGKRRHGR